MLRVLVVLLFVACAEPAPDIPSAADVRVSVEVAGPDGEPVESTRVFVDGRLFGVTDMDGRFVGDLQAEVGATLMVDLVAPAGYRALEVDTRRMVKVEPSLVVDYRATLRRDAPPATPPEREIQPPEPETPAPPPPRARIRRTRAPSVAVSTPKPPREPAPTAAPALPAGPAPVATGDANGCERLDDIRGDLERTGWLQRGDVALLEAMPERAPCHGEAQRVRASYCFRIGDHTCRAEALEAATRRGRLRHDPRVLLSLAEAYARQRRYPDADRTMRRVERRITALRPVRRVAAYRLSAELAEAAIEQALGADEHGPMGPSVTRVIDKWTRYRTVVGAGSAPGAVATRRIERLQRVLETL